MNGTRRLAVTAGLLFLLADVAGVAFFIFVGGLGTGQAYVDAAPGHQAQIGLAALSIFVMGAAGVGIVTAFYPVLRAQNEALAIGSVLFRAVAEGLAFFEAAITLATVSIAQAASVPSSSAQNLSLMNALLDTRDQLALVAVTAFGIAALLYCSAFYMSAALPRWLAGWGVLGAIVWLAGSAWAFVSHSPDGGLAMAPLALNEIVMALWLIARGFSTPRAVRMPSAAFATA